MKNSTFGGGEGVIYGTLLDQNHSRLSGKKIGKMVEIIGPFLGETRSSGGVGEFKNNALDLLVGFC